MKFIIDSQLPKRLADALTASGHDAIHTLSLQEKNRSTDSAIALLADRQQRIVISKDDDFVQALLVNGQPPLLLISTGNIANDALEKLVRANLPEIEAAFVAHRFVEITRDALIIRE